VLLLFDGTCHWDEMKEREKTKAPESRQDRRSPSSFERFRPDYEAVQDLEILLRRC
jgi:hypothetical protein